VGEQHGFISEHREPTHVVRIEVPLHLEERPAEVDLDVVRDAVLTVLSFSRAVYLKAICDDAQVSMIEWPTSSEALHDESDDLRRAAQWVVDNWDSQASQHLSMKALRRAVSEPEGEVDRG
jgi:hypothetical protein